MAMLEEHKQLGWHPSQPEKEMAAKTKNGVSQHHPSSWIAIVSDRAKTQKKNPENTKKKQRAAGYRNS